MIYSDYTLTRFATPAVGVRIIEDRNLVDTVEDWSKVRSPSRALRRRKQGHPQRITYRQVPKKEAFSVDGGRTLIMHPELAREIEREIAARMERLAENIIMGRQ